MQWPWRHTESHPPLRRSRSTCRVWTDHPTWLLLTSVSVCPNTSIIGDCDRLAEALGEKQYTDIYIQPRMYETVKPFSKFRPPLVPGDQSGLMPGAEHPIDWVLLASGKSNKGWNCGSL